MPSQNQLVVRLGAVSALLLLLAFCNSSAPGETQTAGPDSPTTAKTADAEPSIQSPFVDILPPELVDSIGYLQAAIDLRLERDVAQCMRDGGFEYRDVVPGNSAPPENDPIEDALAILDPDYERPGDAGSDPNQEVRQSLTPEEFDVWDLYHIDCVIGSPHNVANPLASEMQWWTQIYSDVNDRVQADARFIEASNVEQQCLVEQGYPEGLADEQAKIGAEASELRSSDRAIDDAIERLHELADYRDQLEETSSLCKTPRDILNNQIFRELIRDATVEDPQVGLWVAELQRTVDEYSLEIDFLLDG